VSGQQLNISNDFAEYHLFGGKYHLKRKKSDAARMETHKPLNGTLNGAMRTTAQ
jgi:hypothetical protein